MIRKTITIRKDQEDWIKKHYINPSRFVDAAGCVNVRLAQEGESLTGLWQALHLCQKCRTPDASARGVCQKE